MTQRVVVIGGGIIGAAFALRLALSGSKVALFDAGQKQGGLATPASWAWINASWGNAEHYFRLRHHSMALWHKLEAQVPGLVMQWNGGLLWDLPELDLRAFVEKHANWGYDVRLIGSDEISVIEPNLLNLPRLAAHARSEGAVEPVHAVEKILKAAQEAGAEILQGVRVKRLIEENGRIVGVMTEDGIVNADVIVSCTGIATGELLKPFGIELAVDAPTGLLVHSEPVSAMMNGLVLAPELHVRQTPDGCLVAGSDYGGMDPGDNAEAAATKLFGMLQGFIRSGDRLKLSHFTVGQRPTPQDGVSAIGRLAGLDGLYLCCTHSGMTLAPALAELGTKEIMTEEAEDMLLPFRPARLLRKA